MPSMTVRDINEYEDLLAEWSDLESGLATLLANPEQSRQFSTRVVQYDHWMRSLLERDADVGLYLLFQLASNSPVGYSGSHALVCAVLCHLICPELMVAPWDRDSLVCAAFTMNVAMTRMQDTLATQRDKPTPEQQEMIQQHQQRSVAMLESLGVTDAMWLSIVASHHDNRVDAGPFDDALPVMQLSRILKLVDRYAAMISPRLSRAGRTATESGRVIMASATAQEDPVGHAVVHAIGLCPPGTFVRLDSNELGIVIKRSAMANHPYIAIVGNADGELLSAPRLHDTARGSPRIQSSLPASSVHAQLKHALVLQLAGNIDPH